MERNLPVDVVVINYNGAEIIGDTIHSILKQTYPIGRIVVVDDASTDNSIAVLRTEFPQCEIIQFEKNVNSNQRAKNAGLARCSAEYVFFTDNDVVLDPQCLAKLVVYMTQFPDAALVTPRLLYKEDVKRIFNDWTYYHYTGNVVAPNRNRLLSDAESPAVPQQTAGGGIILLDREKVAQVRNFGEEYYFGWSDGTIMYALKLKGYGCYCCAEALAYHPTVVRSTQRAFAQVHNKATMALEYFQLRTLILLSPMLVLYECMLFIFLCLKRTPGAMIRAHFAVLRNMRTILERRAFFQRDRRVRDRDILCAGTIYFSPALISKKNVATIFLLINKVFDAYWNCVNRVL